MTILTENPLNFKHLLESKFISNENIKQNNFNNLHRLYSTWKLYKRRQKKQNDTAHYSAKINTATRAVITNYNVTASKIVSELKRRQRRETSVRFPGGEEVQTTMTEVGFRRRSV